MSSVPRVARWSQLGMVCGWTSGKYRIYDKAREED